ncbi:hypothetical protein QTP88_020802 [Uroleucon formosanum]
METKRITKINYSVISGDTFNCFDYDIAFEQNSIFETVKNIVTQPSQIESDTLVENFVMEQTDQAQYEYIEIESINPNQCFEYDNIEQENQIQNDNVVVEHINPISLEEEAETETEDPQILLPKRKRLKKPEKWKRNIKKLAKNRGEEYIRASGLIVKAKSLKPPCENCRYKCSSILNLEIRNKIKAKFWEMGDKRNIGFFQPKKDQCSICEAWKNCSDIEKEINQTNYDAHMEAKIKCREEKEKDVAKAREGMVQVCCYELQAVLQTPCGEVNMFYYKRKLGIYNFTVYETSSRNGYCYVWSEDKAKRGANEIASCLWKYLNNSINHSMNLPIIFYSDNCVGQNKNKFIISLYMYATMRLEIPSVTHKFLVCGHSQNKGDAMHACIEKQKKRVLKSGPVYIPDQWIPVISLARKGVLNIVNQMITTDMLDFKKLSTQIGTNFNINTDKEKVLWGNIKIIEVRKDSPFKFFYKNNMSEEKYKTIDVTQKLSRGRKSKPKINEELILNEAYSRPPGITDVKKKDLMQLCDANVIPNCHKQFYENINVCQRTDSDDE